MGKNILVGEVSLEDLLERLSFSEEETARATLEQAKLFMAAANYRIQKMKKYQQAKRKLADMETQTSLSMRIRYAKSGDKLTERYLTDLVSQEDAVKLAAAELDKAESLEEWAKLLLEAYRQRRDVLKILAQFAFVDDELRLGFGGMKKLVEEKNRLRGQLKDRDDEEA